MAQELRKEYEKICLDELAELSRDLEVVMERADKIKRALEIGDKILYYSDGIMRMEWILRELKPVLFLEGAQKLKEEADAELKKYHAGRLKLLDKWLNDSSQEHWQYEFEEEIKSFRASGQHDFMSYPSEADFQNVWRWSEFPVHPMIRVLRKHEDRLSVYIFLCRLRYPVRNLVWCLREMFGFV